MVGSNSYVSESLRSQISDFITSLERFNEKRVFEGKRSSKDYVFLKDFFIRFFEDRNHRAKEVHSTLYDGVKKLALAEFPVPTYWNLCMDGRVKSVLTNGATALVGASIRIPGGIIRDFLRGSDGDYMLSSDSYFARIIDQALSWSENGVIAEVFDSHVGCAARKVEEEAKGRNLEDYGLLSDVLHKKEMIVALMSYVTNKYGESKKIIGIQTSFDPHNGFLYMGLETDKAIALAREKAEEKEKTTGKKQRWEYTPDILKQLVASEEIIYSKELLLRPEFQTAFTAHAFKADWANTYVLSAKHFWEGIEQMKGKLIPLIEKQLVKIYPALTHPETRQELDERSMLLLTNAFIGYIHNQGTYPYSIHREECVKISRGGFPPYEISAFVVLGENETTVSSDVELAAALVRTNRKAKHVEDRSGNFTDPDEFAQAPVPLIVQEILPEPIREDIWETLTTIDWSDLPNQWAGVSDQEFFTYLEQKGEIPLAVANGINKLRHTMAILFDPTTVTAGRLVSHHKVALPVMVGKNRMNYFIIPFVKHGFS